MVSAILEQRESEHTGCNLGYLESDNSGRFRSYAKNREDIERIEERREMNPDMDAIYLLSPQPHIVDCLLADFERRRYRKSFLVWTALLDPQMRRRLDVSKQVQEQMAGFETLSIDFFPRESHLITFRDPWSFPILYHPACNSLVLSHMQLLSQKEELDAYAKFNQNWPPPSTRPQGVLVITDRSMDIMAPLIHEFTYQAMAHDLLPIKDGEKTFYRTVVNEGTGQAEEKDMEIGEKDKIWVNNRHMHMKDTIEKLMGDFQKFIDDNPNFTNSEDATSLNAIKDMLAGLPQFQEMKEAYSLHLSMAQECMNIFQQRKLPDIASVEQTLATGLDEDFRKPKNLLDQVVRLLDDESIGPADRLRLIMLYIIFRDGMIQNDIQRLLAHAGLPPQDAEVITNLDLIGAHTIKTNLKDVKPPPQPLFPTKAASLAQNEEYALSRFEPMVKLMLEGISKGNLDQMTFPYIRPPIDNSDELAAQQQTSLRSAKPTWARNRTSNVESRQRIIVFIAGGATYSESRACYEVSKATGKDIFLATSHMVTPALYVRQVGDLTADRRVLDLPIDRPKPKAPDHLFARNDPRPAAPPAGPGIRPGMRGLPGGPGGPAQIRSPGPPPPPQKSPSYNTRPNPYDRPAPQPPTAALANMSMNNSSPGGSIPLNGANGAQSTPSHGKLDKKSKNKGNGEGGEKEKKKRGFFGQKK
ncbi:Sec1 family protein [Drepanopeziza brunnea f. sp. 'multigermtubi' MB_m1]|uniref:Sec1 family protein n=1 Tax=Marssonina brunnea f. sp. multigermtubi (strain MB_m1) TaxID=1072389 RepID=K1Y975_MARBU|nr:Sec1 family protein [Drepanopeziza brunnea f. sp. 'multigermtubi' MB_m1]EKD21689.1 Sec1 family protein [Drepanopeziza brunnea f. sp. 'multigermtubi' MB_m1]